MWEWIKDHVTASGLTITGTHGRDCSLHIVLQSLFRDMVYGNAPGCVRILFLEALICLASTRMQIFFAYIHAVV